jgi:hypothetical protein
MKRAINTDGSVRRIELDATTSLRMPTITVDHHSEPTYEMDRYHANVYGQFAPQARDEIRLVSDSEPHAGVVEQTINLICHETMHGILLDLVGPDAFNGLDNVEDHTSFLRHHTDKLSGESETQIDSIMWGDSGGSERQKS